MGSGGAYLGYEDEDGNPVLGPRLPKHNWMGGTYNAGNDWGDTTPFGGPKKSPGKPEQRQERLNAAPTLAEIWRRRAMLGQKAMDKEGTKYQIGG